MKKNTIICLLFALGVYDLVCQYGSDGFHFRILANIEFAAAIIIYFCGRDQE